VKSCRPVHDLARGLGVEMPIVEQVEQVLYHGRPAREAVTALMSRRAKPETDR
jgi:glycerol-3-phosphate dehydrogenase (NAD(P)+)